MLQEYPMRIQYLDVKLAFNERRKNNIHILTNFNNN